MRDLPLETGDEDLGVCGGKVGGSSDGQGEVEEVVRRARWRAGYPRPEAKHGAADRA